ncbi:MAG: c-type cytochrome, partial [Gimesia sp.]|nr:c-type cytochrome [Gimesia sp.]
MYGSQVARFAISILSVVLAFNLLFPSVSQSAPKTESKSGAAPQIDFKKTIQPIFVKHCQDCHGPDAREGGLRLTNRKNILMRNDSGEPAIVAGKSDASILMHRVSSQDEKEQMPPADTGERLSKQEIQILKQWIDQGAIWPTDSDAPGHWAYTSPVKSPQPTMNGSSRVNNPI